MIRQELTILLAVSILFGIYLVYYAGKRRMFPGAGYFVLIIYCMFVYNIGYICEINSTVLSRALFCEDVAHLTIPVLPYLWLMMCLDFVGAGQKIKGTVKYVMLIHPVCYYAVYFTNGWHHLYFTSCRLNFNGYYYALYTQKGPLFIAVTVSISFIGAVCLSLLIRGLVKSARMQRLGYVIMLIASIFHLGAVYLNTTNTNFLDIDYFSAGSFFTAFLYMLGIFNNCIFCTVPLETETIYRRSNKGFALIDYSDRIIDANEAFLKIFSKFTNIKSFTLDTLKCAYPELSEISDQNSPIYFKKVTGSEHHHFQADMTTVISENETVVGKILEVVNVTAFIEKENLLQHAVTNAVEQANTSETSFLQAQISPHFINNTLSAIACLIGKDDAAAKEVVTDLGEYLFRCYHISLSQTVLLFQELETVDTYVRIEKARFGTRLHYEVTNGAPKDIEVPKLVLQPLVENAIRHGILPKAKGGNIMLRITADSKRAYFEVADDGIGIEQERLCRLLDGTGENNGIGLENINRRLTRYYGSGLSIDSMVGRGTKVSFSIPISCKVRSGEGAEIC